MKNVWQNKFILSIILLIVITISLNIYWRIRINNADSDTTVISSANTHSFDRLDTGEVTSSVFLDYLVISETPIPTPTRKPTTTPKPTIIVYSSSDLEEWFTKYSQKESIDRNLLRRIAVCESGLNPRATNGIYGGLFQFSTSSWITNRRAMNMDTNPDRRFNPEEAIRTAAFRIATAGIHAWPNCNK